MTKLPWKPIDEAAKDGCDLSDLPITHYCEITPPEDDNG